MGYLRNTLAKSGRAFVRQQLDEAASLTDVWQARERAYDGHVAGLSTQQCAAWALRRVADSLLAPRRWLTHQMFPIATMAFNNTLARMEDYRGDVPRGHHHDDFQLQSVGLINQQHLLLDGMWVRRGEKFVPDTPRPVMVFVPPNGMTYEEMLVPACQFASLHDADVLLFNYRGIGKSMGRLDTIEDAVHDTCTFLAYACSLGVHVGVLGLSMGGGTAAAAIAKLQDTLPVTHDAISLFAATHTFSCWFDVLRARKGRHVARLFFAAVRLSGMRDLDTQALWRKRPLAHVTLVIEAMQDQVLPEAARLVTHFGAMGHKTVLAGLGHSHGDLSFIQQGPQAPASSSAGLFHGHVQAWRNQTPRTATKAAQPCQRLAPYLMAPPCA